MPAIHAYAAKSAKQKLEPFDYEPGALGADEVEVKVTHCGICHSDVAMIDNDWGMTKYPFVPGHEVIGTVAAVGSNVQHVKVGQRVGVGWQSGSCGHCEWCISGQENFCAEEKDTIIGRPGGWGDRVRTSWRFAIPIPDNVASEHAGPLMCAGTTVFSPMLHFGVTPVMRTAVVGIGGLGHLALQYLAKFGCDVTAISSSHGKEDEARQLGADHFIATKDEGAMKKAKSSFDFILATISGGVNWAEYIDALRPHGQLVIVGAPEAEVKASLATLIAAEKSIRGGRAGSPADTAKMLDFTARHGIKPMIETFPFKEVNAAVDRLRSGKARYRVVLVA